MKFGKLTVLDKITSDDIDTEDQNIMLNAFRISVNNSLTLQNMIDGIIDEYEDETGVNTASSTNELHDATDKLYRPTKDPNTKVLLHFNGNDEDTSTEDFSSSNHPITLRGTAQLDTSNKQFGSASVLLDGDSDDIFVGDLSILDFGHSLSTNRTAEFFVRTTDITGAARGFIEFGERFQAGGRIQFELLSGEIVLFLRNGADTILDQINTGVNFPDDGNFHHVALVKIQDEYGIYLDGTQIGYLQTSNTVTHDEFLYIGSDGQGNWFWDGHFDEFRYQNDNSLGASPNVGLTDTITVPTSAYSIGEDMTLISDSFTAEVQPESAQLILFQEDIEGIILNTDLKAHISRDGGTTFTEVTLVDEGNYKGIKRILSSDIDISAQPAGTSMVYKIETLNNKEAIIHGTGLTWE